MKSLRLRLNASTVLPMVAGFGVVIAGPMLASGPSAAEQATLNPEALPYIQVAQCNPCNPCAANPCNPCAANPCNPCAANPCNPCAANPCNPCNPCAANPCNPCNPCGASANPCNPCGANPCNPCAAGAGGAHSSRCFVPRLQTAGYNPCNPCAAGWNPCNPCAAANPCNPCAANPCNPCAANPCNPCNPCAAAANPCNPCAANPCNPCNPCAAAANPCNPCAANPCNPCNPCGAAGGSAELTAAEALAAYDCLRPELQAAYAASGNAIAINYQAFDYYSTAPYVSALHGSRYVMNQANQSGSAYRRYEEAGTMRNGSVLSKDSFVVGANGQLSVGPLFLMQKMPAGFNAASADWKYTMVMPDGSIFGETNGSNSAAVQFCIDCHEVAGTDHMFFLPVEFRVN